MSIGFSIDVRRRRARRTVLVTFVASAMATLTVAAAAQAGAMQADTTPVDISTPGHLQAIDGVTAVGYSVTTGGASLARVERYDGIGWREISAESPEGSVSSDLAGVDDEWAVGSYVDGSGTTKTLIEHSNGHAWSVVPSPNPAGTSDSILSAVSEFDANNAWAVGIYLADDGTVRTLIERWDGQRWRLSHGVDAGGSGGTFLSGVQAQSPTSVYAVGYAWNGTKDVSLIEHLGRHRWTQVDSPDPGGSTGSYLRAINGAGSTITAVGYYTDDVGTSKTLVVTTNGHAWSQVSSPNPKGSAETYLSAVSVNDEAAGNWAVGYYTTPTGDVGTLTEHGVAGEWTIVKSPNRQGSDVSGLEGVSNLSTTDAWAVGVYDTSTGDPVPLVERWDGTHWKVSQRR